MPDLARMIAAQGSDLRLRQAVVVAAPAAGLCTIRFGGSDAADNIAGVRSLVGVANGDTVWVLQTGGALLIVGTVDTGWIEVTSFTNSWVNYGAGFPTAAYHKIGDLVYLKGLLKNGTVSAAAFTLPAGFRPTTTRHFITMMSAGAGGLRVNASGNVIFGDPSGGGNGYCSLDGIYFETTG
jgi:hypothetical protein